MKKSLFVVAIAIIVGGCSSDANVEQNAANSEVENVEGVVVPNSLLSMEIDGMVCQMGCGGSIRKELKAINGVSGVEFDFEDERETNVAKISFDKDLTNVDAMIEAISKLNDGQFKVGNTSSEDIHTVSSYETTSSKSSENSNVEVTSSKMEMPNLLDLLSGLISL